MDKGNVKFFNDEKGFGFIERDGQSDLFFHVTEIQNNELLDKGDEVVFEIAEGKRGQIAKKVQRA